METVLNLFKSDLGITHSLRDEFFLSQLLASKQELARKGIDIDLSDVEDQVLLSDFTAWKYRNRTSDIPISNNLICTVEIGGNTAGLTKALQNVNKETNAMQRELQQIERLLKLDPKNTELLAQKQTLLASSIETTKGKLEALKNAEKQASSDMTNGIAVNETQYRKLQREIVATEQNLKELEKQTNNIAQAFKKASDNFKNFGDKTSDLGKKGIPITVAVGAASAASIKLASDYQESLNKIDVAFKDNSSEVQEWANGSLKNFGIAKGTALDLASLFGDMGTAMGLSTGEAANMSTSLVGLAGDLASFKNIGIDQAQDALKGIFTGEGESLKSLGVIMQDSTLKEYALAQGIKKKYEDMTQSEKVQLRYNYVMEMTKNAQGDFARTSDGTANSTRIFAETVKELGTQIGEKLLPIITPIIQKITEWVQWFGNLDGSTQTAILVIGGIIAIIPPLLILIGSMTTGIGAVTTAVGAMNLAFLANLIGIVIAAIAGLVAGIVVLWNTNEGFRNALIGAWNAIKDACVNVWNIIVKFFTEDIPNAFNATINFVKNNWAQILLLITNPIAGAISLLYKLNPKFKEWVEGLINDIKNWFGGMVDIGKNLIEGLWNGISNTVEWLKGKVKGVVDTIKGWFTGKEGFDERSPSKWSQQVMEYVTQGMAIGLTNGQGTVMDTVDKLVTELKSKVTNSLTGINSETENLNLKYELWENTDGKDATDQEKQAKKTELLNNQLEEQAGKVSILDSQYKAIASQYGEQHELSIQAQNDLLKEQIAMAKLTSQIADMNKVKDQNLTSYTPQSMSIALSQANQRASLLGQWGYSKEAQNQYVKDYMASGGTNKNITVNQTFNTPTATPSQVSQATKKGLKSLELAGAL